MTVQKTHDHSEAIARATAQDAAYHTTHARERHLLHPGLDNPLVDAGYSGSAPLPRGLNRVAAPIDEIGYVTVDASSLVAAAQPVAEPGSEPGVAFGIQGSATEQQATLTHPVAFVGAKVFLNSGGPEMSVTALEQERSGLFATCVWDGGEDVFPVEALTDTLPVESTSGVGSNSISDVDGVQSAKSADAEKPSEDQSKSE